MSVKSKTGLTNEALYLIRASGQIANFDTDDTPNGKAARMYLDSHISEALSCYDWASFAETLTLVDISDEHPPPPHYLYRYSMPTNCLVPRRIVVSGMNPNDTPYPFDVEIISGGGQRSILTDVAPAYEPWLRFTSDAQRENVQNWPAEFYRAVSYRLAASLATAIKESPQLAESMMRFYVDSLNMAWYIDQSGRTIGKNQDPSSARARRGEAT